MQGVSRGRNGGGGDLKHRESAYLVRQGETKSGTVEDREKTYTPMEGTLKPYRRGTRGQDRSSHPAYSEEESKRAHNCHL